MSDCPSYRPEMPQARAIGIVGGTGRAPRVTYLRHAVPAGDLPPPETAPVSLTSFLRFAGPCAETGCVHFDGCACRLGAEIARQNAAGQELPGFCPLRKTCRWYAENGFAACRGCLYVVSERPPLRVAATP